MQVGDELGVGHGDDQPAGGDATDLGEEGAGLGDMFEHFDTQGSVERAVGERQARTINLGVRQTGGGEGGAIGGLHLGAMPVVAGGAELGAIPAEAATDIDHADGR